MEPRLVPVFLPGGREVFRQSGAHEAAAVYDRLHGSQQLSSRVDLQKIAARTGLQTRLGDIRGVLLADKQDPRVRTMVEDSTRRFDPVDDRKADVQHNQIRLQR